MAHGKIILVVDNDPGARHLLRFVLAKTGCKIVTAADGAEALALAASQNISLLVTDLVMDGEMDGFQLAQVLYQMPTYAQLPVIALSAYWQAESQPGVEHNQRIILVPKPFSPIELTSQVNKLLNL